MNFQEEFWQRVKQEWLPAYCNDPLRNYDVAGFRTDAKQISDVDARDFLRALDRNVVAVDKGGRFRMPRSSVNEVIFWEHPAKVSPRPISLWIEPVITIAAVARLHLDYGWPIECLGMQSVDWAFDLVAFKPDEPEHEFIAGEVKATGRELDNFVARLRECCVAGDHDCVNANRSRKNAHRKWLGLKRSRAPVLWALGPSGDSRIFDVQYRKQSRIQLNPVTENASFSVNDRAIAFAGSRQHPLIASPRACSNRPQRPNSTSILTRLQASCDSRPIYRYFRHDQTSRVH